MRNRLILAILVLALLPGATFCQEMESIEGRDDLEAFATFFRIAVFPIDLFGTPSISIWGEAWALPARGLDLIEYQDKYYYDYGTMAWRESDDKKRPGSWPLGEYRSPGRRARRTPSILYLPPAKR